MKKIIIYILSYLFTTQAIAEPSNDNTFLPNMLIQFGLGINNLSSDNILETDKKGHVLQLGLQVYKEYDSSFAFSSGGGFLTTKMKGDSSFFKGQTYELNGPHLNISGFWMFHPEWHVGASAYLVFGVESDFGPIAEGKKNNLFTSIDAYYRPIALERVWWFGSHYQLDLNISKRDYRAFLLSISYLIPYQPSKMPDLPPKKIPQTGTLQLIIAANHGIPLKDVSYTIHLGSEQKPLQGVIQDTQPQTFTDIPKGMYEVEVAAEGYKTEVKKFVIGAKQTSKLVVKLISLDQFQIQQSFDLGVINFEFGKTTIISDSFANLDKAVQVLRENPGLKKLSIEGHTDSVGERAFNMKLSQGRAKAVMDYLVSKGIPQERLESHGFGSEAPVADNTTEEGRAQNRRVEFVVKSLTNN